LPPGELNSYDSILKLISQMTLEEKVAMCHGATLFMSSGVERLGIPPLKMSDGPHGVREELYPDDWHWEFRPLGLANDASTCFPCLCALAATWNPNLAEEYGAALGQESRARAKDLHLVPGINIARSPLCGRNFEYMGEDPYLTSKMCVPYIHGVQNQGVGAGIKHFAVNNQEFNRFHVDVIVDERTLREIYLPAFKAAVQEGKAYSVIGAYNKFRGQYCCHNEHLLNDILKGEWQFDGIVISDWDGVHDTQEAANYGLDIEMGTTKPFHEYYLAKPYLEAIQSGKIDENTVDDKVRRILRTMFKNGMFEKERKKGSFNTPKHQKAALKVAQQSIVLLKNSDGILPLDARKLRAIAVIGDNADRYHAHGGGSSMVKALYEVTPLAGLKKRFDGKLLINYAQGYSAQPKMADQLLQEAVDAAANADVAIVFGGLNHDVEAEGFDRMDMKLPFGQDELIARVLQANPKTVIVLTAGSPVDMTYWNDKASAVILSWYGGMESGTAISDVLFGDVNPSGKLPVTFPKRLEDSPAHSIGDYPGPDVVTYKEGIFVGYRYFDSMNIDPMFCFGHGLSYSAFEYGELKIERESTAREENVVVRFSIRNTGELEGAETAQVYIRDVESSLVRPFKELKAFKKVFIKPNEKKTVTISLDKSSLSYYDPDKKGWIAEKGVFEVLVGSSSRDIRIFGSFEV